MPHLRLMTLAVASTVLCAVPAVFAEDAPQQPAPAASADAAAVGGPDVNYTHYDHQSSAEAAPSTSGVDTTDRSQVILYQGGSSRKLGRGLANVLTSWAELPLGMERTAREEGQLAGLTLGLLRGLGRTLLRTVDGAFETLTFLLPNPGNIGYAPMLQPEYINLEDLL